MSTTRRRGPYSKTSERRAEIIAAALEAYAAADARGPALRSIANVAGMSEQAIQHHFPTKDELFVAVLRDRDAMAVAAQGNGRERSEEDLDLIEIMRRNESQPGLIRLYTDLAAAAADASHAAHDFFVERFRLANDGVARYYARRRTGNPDATPTEDDAWAARVTISAADGLQSRWLIEGGDGVSEDLARLVDVLSAAASSGRPASQGSADADG